MAEYRLVIGNKNYSSWSLRPWLWMKQSGIDFEEVRISLQPKGIEKELEPYFSNTKVPVLLVGKEQIWDSLAILEYLAEVFPEHAWPEENMARARARAVVAEMHSSFMAMRDRMPLNCRKHFIGFKPDEELTADIGRIEAIWNDCRERYAGNGDWLFGGFSIADAFYAPVALRFRTYGIELHGAAGEYMSTLLENPYVRQWVEEGSAENETIDWVEIDQSKFTDVIEVTK